MIKRILFVVALGSFLSACLPAFSESQSGPTPVPDEVLRLTAAALSEQTLAALPTQSPIPTETPVILSPEPTATQPSPTETENPVLLTLTATLLAATSTPGTPGAETPGGSETAVASGQAAATSGTPFSGGAVGTQAPFLPYGTIKFFNKSDADAYISLRCVTREGYVTLLEYPVNKNLSISAPAGSYTYVAWVGGAQFDGSFKMDKDGFVTITFYKNRINIKKD